VLQLETKVYSWTLHHPFNSVKISNVLQIKIKALTLSMRPEVSFVPWAYQELPFKFWIQKQPLLTSTKVANLVLTLSDVTPSSELYKFTYSPFIWYELPDRLSTTSLWCSITLHYKFLDYITLHIKAYQKKLLSFAIVWKKNHGRAKVSSKTQ
jgi:hypothetical protein